VKQLNYNPKNPEHIVRGFLVMNDIMFLIKNDFY